MNIQKDSLLSHGVTMLHRSVLRKYSFYTKSNWGESTCRRVFFRNFRDQIMNFQKDPLLSQC